MKSKQFTFLLEQISTELSVLLTASDIYQQSETTDVIAQVFVDYELDIAEAWNEYWADDAEPTKEDYLNDQADDLRSQMIADRIEDELKEGIL